MVMQSPCSLSPPVVMLSRLPGENQAAVGLAHLERSHVIKSLAQGRPGTPRRSSAAAHSNTSAAEFPVDTTGPA